MKIAVFFLSLSVALAAVEGFPEERPRATKLEEDENLEAGSLERRNEVSTKQ